VHFNGLLAQVEVGGNLLVRQALYNQAHHLPLAGRQHAVTLLNQLGIRPRDGLLGVVLDGATHRLQQTLRIDRFFEEIEGVLLHRRHGRGDFAFAGHDDHGQEDGPIDHLGLQLQAGHAVHVQVEHDAAAVGRVDVLEERLGRRVMLGDQSSAAQDLHDISSGDHVVFDDENARLHGCSCVRHGITNVSLLKRFVYCLTQRDLPEVGPGGAIGYGAPVGPLFGFILGLAAGLVAAWAASRYLYQRLLAAREQARKAERLAELGTLTGGLAHEIKNPLSTIQLNLGLVAEDLVPGQPASQRVVNRMATITREAARLRTILDDFLRYAGQIHLQPEPTDLNDLLGDLVDFLSPQAQIARIQLRQEPAPEPVTADIDPRLIKQAVLNLMLNAMQLMPGGGELIVGAHREDDNAVLVITDTGPGISAEDQQHVFEAYFSKRKGGTGLGLALTRRIAREHGGDVRLVSEPGKGSSFSIVLPVHGKG